MKDKIINVVVIVVMVVIANYPLYTNLKSTAKDVNNVVQTIHSEVIAWQSDIKIVQSNIEGIRLDLTNTINNGVEQTNNVLDKVTKLESDIEILVSKIDSLKIKPVKAVEDLFKIKG